MTGEPKQLSRADLRTMSAEEVVGTYRDGALDRLLSGKSFDPDEPARGRELYANATAPRDRSHDSDKSLHVHVC